MNTVLQRLCPAQQELLWNGAYIRFEDGGALYYELRACGRVRTSSHRSVAQTYEVMLEDHARCAPPILLVGRTRTGTWMQTERHSARWCGLGLHCVDYVVYKLTGRNQGAYGNSSYTEHNPLILRVPPSLQSVMSRRTDTPPWENVR